MKYTVSNKTIEEAMAAEVRVLVPWPTETLGEYGSHMFNGSPTTPQGEDAAMDKYVYENLDAKGLSITSIIAGRTNKLIPVITVTLAETSLAKQLSECRRENQPYSMPGIREKWAVAV